MYCSFCAKSGPGSDLVKCEICGTIVCGACRIGDKCPTCEDEIMRDIEPLSEDDLDETESPEEDAGL